MKKPLLSILIPSIPSRFERAINLYRELEQMCAPFQNKVEILMLVDNKIKTIGEKREHLKNISSGIFFMFVDDDDSLLSVVELIDAIEKNPSADVITFKQRCRNADGSEFIVTFGLGNEVEHNSLDGRYIDCKRPPFHVCAWNRKFKIYSFGFVNYSEDWFFVKQAIAMAKKEVFIDKIIHSYNFDPLVTEADTSSNSIWTNPNKQPFKKNQMSELAIVNLVTREKQRYLEGQMRLRQSLIPHANGYDCLYYIGESSVGAPHHLSNPYAFKIYAIQEAMNLGFKKVFWLDASVVAVRNIHPVIEWLNEKKIFMEEAGHYVGDWCNDATLNYFQITREEAMKMPMFSAGFIGFDFTDTLAKEFFAEWRESMLNGMFKGDWSNHRHDMTCASIIANKRGLVSLYSPGGQFFSYVGPGYAPPSKTSVFQLQGL